MDQRLRPSELVPSGFKVDRVMIEGTDIVITIRHRNTVGICPSCGRASRPGSPGFWLTERRTQQIGRPACVRSPAQQRPLLPRRGLGHEPINGILESENL